VFFSYKKYFSVVFQGLVDAYSKLIAVVQFHRRKKNNFPEPEFLPHRNVTAPYTTLEDDACLENDKPWNVLLEFCIGNGVLFRKQ
jgi:hypothetical protein